ncbi:GntR family transcriptional regulator [uncultured Friedmanniella sp.]|uniref:GntR family transcriptional regulator n=1 Tax=uncultured Friedmanniella sp. TaxID=335381 RepID=UPI0035C9E971
MSTQPDATPVLSPLVSSTRREIAVASIRSALLSGELVPGQRIKETAMAALLGISRPTVREAMNQLISEGSLVQEPYKGVRVAHPSAQDLADVAEVRVSLETLAALRIARDPHGPAMSALRTALARHLDTLRTDNDTAAGRTHLDLHRTLWEVSGNLMLAKFWPLVEAQISIAMTIDRAARDAPGRDAGLHQRLVDVIAAGEEAAITAEVRRHIAASTRPTTVVGAAAEEKMGPTPAASPAHHRKAP